MTAFQAGFIKEAVNYGLSERQATHMFNRAIDYHEIQAIVKTSAVSGEYTSTDTLEELANLLDQHKADLAIQQAKKKITF